MSHKSRDTTSWFWVDVLVVICTFVTAFLWGALMDAILELRRLVGLWTPW